ncbi:MAG: DUF2461 domain-containing protein [Bacteroidota bacterium]
MSKQFILDFLRDLAANNNKDWMHEHKKRYLKAKGLWIEEVAHVLNRLTPHEPEFANVIPKKTIMRITNNRRFHPDRPLYRDNFASAPVQDMNQPAFYMHISPGNCFIGGGLHRPPMEQIRKLRSAIDYDGENLQSILEGKDFQGFFGGLSDDPDALKSSPRGYDADHPQIELLRRKSFTAIRQISDEDFVGDGFVDLAEEAFLLLRPFNQYLQRAVEFDMVEA